MLAETTKPRRLRELLPTAQFFPAACDPRVAVVKEDASRVEPGDLYVHLDPIEVVGAELAAERGAAAIVTDRLMPVFGVPQIVAACPRTTLAELRRELKQGRDAAPRLMAVAASLGADRIATRLAAVFAAAGQPAGLMTSQIEDDGETCRTRHEGRSARIGWLDRCELEGLPMAVYSADPNATRPLTASLACLAGLRCDGLGEQADRLWPSVVRHREAITAQLDRLEPGATLVVNADDPECVAHASRHNGPVITFGSTTHADLHATLLAEHGGGQEFLITHGADSACVALRRNGLTHRTECLAAVATAVAAGVDLQLAVDGAQVAPEPELASEPLVHGQDFRVMVDGAMRPVALRGALEAARASTEGRVFAVIRLADHPMIAHEQIAAAAAMADRVLATGGPVDGVALPTSVSVVDDRFAALALAIGLADGGDAVLLAGCQASEPGWCEDKQLASELIRQRQGAQDRRRAA